MNHVKNLSYYLFFFLLVCGCGDANNNQDGEVDAPIFAIDPVDLDLAAIKERGYLNAIVDNSATSYFIYKGRPMGYEYEMLKWFTDDLGVELRLILKNDIAEALKLLNEGKGDIVAFNLTITKERKRYVDFSEPFYYARQVLVQRKPLNWRKMKLHEIEQELIRDPLELAGDSVVVRRASAYKTRLTNLSEEIGSDIYIIEDSLNTDIDELIKQVANNEIKYTVADEDVAMVNATFNTNIDVKTPISFSQRIAWAVRPNADSLENTINQWLELKQRSNDYYVVYNKYFKNLKRSAKRSFSEFSSVTGTSLSPFDKQIKVAAEKVDWDWLMLASLIYQESKFDPNAQSWAGAVGLMQLVKNTAEEFGTFNRNDPDESLNAGSAFINWLKDRFDDKIADSITRTKFVLAAYNVGLGHIQDAMRLTEKYGGDPTVWDDNVEKYLLLKSKEKYYTDEVVKYGYCRGSEPVNYVRQILERYEQYKQLITNEEVDVTDSEDELT